MALVEVNFHSKALDRLAVFNALIPTDAPEEVRDQKSFERPMKSFYLLHGYTGNYSDWLCGSRIQELSEKYNFAVFMPSGNNSFYLDDTDKGELFGEYVGNELVDYTRAMFPISREKEDTVIGGFSMGGYGALRTGLKYGRFGRIIALSSALILHQIAGAAHSYKDFMADYRYYTRVFGDLGRLLGSDKDPEALIRMKKETNAEIPGIYMACGTEDFLIEENRRYHEFLLAENVAHVYDETPGLHNWDFWNEQIRRAALWAIGI
ncbi:Endo-1,4-beta-xylanase Z [Caprobacter fermentans]|uniref:Acetylesterase n=1 Tax=Caproicibacter fermentans TaxID=2576756 RepID=A0A6N8HW79_9FIRM|nr:alpha/beta hydrolase-fold protein [Caproicibacter fermentans]MVB09810.1 Endo-1,4-beta-xylanase Z [Caproicibacter fermentans]OCN02066.1 acetylesterase [Clostridium sp. W14A]QNK42311.1 acetylesterase [Caproicibacter fermentans]